MGNPDIELVETVCEVAGSTNLIVDARENVPWRSAQVRGDQLASVDVIDWLLKIVSYQGISDAIADRYLETRGAIKVADIQHGLDDATCPKLRSYWTFEGCGYRKEKYSCGCSERIASCPLPRHDLRNGRLNQTSYALWLFVRDIAGGDLVRWIDSSLARASVLIAADQQSRWRALRQSVIEPLSHIYGVADKVLSMALADLFMGASNDRPLWLEAGASMIAIDTLVHNWLHRTGLIERWGAAHPYGPRCYGPNGCAEAVERLSLHVDARAYNWEYPEAFPRFVQKAMWSFCAATQHDRCNGNRIDDRVGCQDDSCPLGYWCERRIINDH